MTEPHTQPAPLSAADADLIAERVCERLIDAVTDPRTVAAGASKHLYCDGTNVRAVG